VFTAGPVRAARNRLKTVHPTASAGTITLPVWKPESQPASAGNRARLLQRQRIGSRAG